MNEAWSPRSRRASPYQVRTNPRHRVWKRTVLAWPRRRSGQHGLRRSIRLRCGSQDHAGRQDHDSAPYEQSVVADSRRGLANGSLCPRVPAHRCRGSPGVGAASTKGISRRQNRKRCNRRTTQGAVKHTARPDSSRQPTSGRLLARAVAPGAPIRRASGMLARGGRSRLSSGPCASSEWTIA